MRPTYGEIRAVLEEPGAGRFGDERDRRARLRQRTPRQQVWTRATLPAPGEERSAAATLPSTELALVADRLEVVLTLRARNDQVKEGAETITIAASVVGADRGGVDEHADAPAVRHGRSSDSTSQAIRSAPFRAWRAAWSRTFDKVNRTHAEALP